MIRHKCSGYYAICQEKKIEGIQSVVKTEDGKKEYYCLRCTAFGVKTGFFNREDVLEKAPFLKRLIETGDNLSDDEFMEKLRNMKTSPWEGMIKDGK